MYFELKLENLVQSSQFQLEIDFTKLGIVLTLEKMPIKHFPWKTASTCGLFFLLFFFFFVRFFLFSTTCYCFGCFKSRPRRMCVRPSNAGGGGGGLLAPDQTVSGRDHCWISAAVQRYLPLLSEQSFKPLQNINMAFVKMKRTVVRVHLEFIYLSFAIDRRCPGGCGG